MAFDNVTIFEVHVPEHLFGRESSTTRPPDAVDAGGSDSGGRSVASGLLVLLALVALALLVWWVRAGDGSPDRPDEDAPDAE